MVRGDGERPGANDFRMKGGDRVYGPGTKLGNYVELEYEPGSVSSAERFSAARMVTDSRLQGADVGGSRAQFGLGIPPPRGASSGSWDWSKPMGPMKPYQDASRWQSLAQSEYPDPSAPRNTEFASTFKLTGGVSDREVLEEYRRRWTTDTKDGADMRFKTTNCAKDDKATQRKFHSMSVRPLRGAPVPLQKVRERLLDCRGFSGLPALRKEFDAMDTSNDGRLSSAELKAGFKALGVEVSDAEMAVIVEYFDTNKDGTVDLQELVVGLRGRMSEDRKAVVSEAYAKLDVTGDGVVTLDDLAQAYRVDDHPDVKTGKHSRIVVLRHHLDLFDAYTKDGTVTLDDFYEYYADVGATIHDDIYFCWMIRSAWKLKDYLPLLPSADKSFKTTHHSIWAASK